MMVPEDSKTQLDSHWELLYNPARGWSASDGMATLLVLEALGQAIKTHGGAAAANTPARSSAESGPARH